jgi:hypothetical protein
MMLRFASNCPPAVDPCQIKAKHRNLFQIGTHQMALNVHEKGMTKVINRRRLLGFAAAALAAPFVARRAKAQVL